MIAINNKDASLHSGGRAGCAELFWRIEALGRETGGQGSRKQDRLMRRLRRRCHDDIWQLEDVTF